MWRIFCRKTFRGHHTISLVEVLTCQANPLRSFLRAALAPSRTAVVRAGRGQSLIRGQASREMGAAACTVAFRPAQKRLGARLGRWQPYAPAGWRGESGKVRAVSETFLAKRKTRLPDKVEAGIPFLMSGFGVKADSLAHLSECRLLANTGHSPASKSRQLKG